MCELDEYASKPLAYFSHDSDAQNDCKLRRLLRMGGVAAYGRWWLLCEALAQYDGHALPCVTALDWEEIADYIDAPTIDAAKDFITMLSELKLIEESDGFLWSRRMHENAKKVGIRRKGAAVSNSVRRR